MANQELTDLEVLAALASNDLFLVRDTSEGKDKQAAASLLLGASGALYDIQDVESSIVATTTSTTFVDLPDMVLTTKDLGAAGHYLIIFDADVEHESINEIVNFQILVDGVPVDFGEIFVRTSGEIYYKNIIHIEPSVSFGTEIKVQWHQNVVAGLNEATVSQRELVILGVPSSQVVI